MRRNIFLIIMLIVFMVALIGCGGTNDTDPPVDPPAGEIDAKGLIDNNCTQCHGLSIVYSDRDENTWPDIVANMAARARKNFTEAEVDAMTEYLQENYSN